MRTPIQFVCSALLAALLVQPAVAQRAGVAAGGGQRTEGAGINYAPQAAVYSVLFVDAAGRTLRLRAADGRTGVVQVGEGVYDLSKLKAGDKVRVDFVAPQGEGDKLRAASIWPVK